MKSCIQVNGFSMMDGILSRKKMKGDGKDILPSVSVRCHFIFFYRLTFKSGMGNLTTQCAMCIIYPELTIFFQF